MEGDEVMSEPQPAAASKSASIEEKQYLLRFNADTQSHLHVMDTEVCMTSCPDKICTIFCPAEVYKWEDIRMHVGYEGCHECGSCRIGCPHQNIKWVYPKGGHGIVFRLG
ncbi:4Fe-4S ferredoxin [Cohnella endophytica]|uniref:Ferredoxin-like protein n=1 Tax=Cohnella endophytica TaxID=2419778 RepID=A0A494XHX8_9BACL|nr:4Fe-4S dicluster domain-containing protein [Cohnella endophytica]RKP50138.1 4Fe-4S ferredoxin [Cohnella endophytica]